MATTMMINMKQTWLARLALAAVAATALLLTSAAHAAVPGITGNSSTANAFSLTASADYTSQPDGAMIYSWGYGCAAGTTPAFAPANFPGACPLMQTPGPTLILTQGQTYTVTLTDELPAAAGNTSILFPGLQVTTSGGVAGLLAQEAAPGTPVTYTITAPNPGTYAYYSGTRPDLQIEMGLFGAVIVYPATAPACAPLVGATDRLSARAAYGVPESCFEREYLFQLSEMSGPIHKAVEAQVRGAGPITAKTEPYWPNYYLVNGRSMPDDMDSPYTDYLPHQPYNANPHLHPGERLLMRVIGVGRWQHPFHHHGNHIRVLARDGGLLLSQSDGTKLAGPLLFTVPSVSGQTLDGIFEWTGQGLNWDVYGPTPHTCNGRAFGPAGQSAGFDPNTYEYCPDHGKTFADSNYTTPDANIVANGLWYGGSPYLGNPGPGLPPGSDGVNPSAGYAYMWHSHDEREITTNDVFPGGMMVMLIVDHPSVTIDEKQ